MRAAMIGASGFLGTALCRQLLEDGWEVFGYDAMGPDQLMPGLQFTEFDVLRDEFSLPPGTDALYYLAQSPHYREFPDAAGHLFGVNTYGAIRAAQAACAGSVGFFCYTSSGNVYVPSLGPLAESHPLRRDEPYALSKIAAEETLSLFGKRMPVLAVRLFGLFGPGQKRMLPATLLGKIHSGQEVLLEPAAGQPGDSDGLVVSFTHVADAARILEQLARHALGGKPLPPVLNVAGPEPISIRRFSIELGRAIGIEPKFALALTERTFNLIADISLLRSVVDVQYTPFSASFSRSASESVGRTERSDARRSALSAAPHNVGRTEQSDARRSPLDARRASLRSVRPTVSVIIPTYNRAQTLLRVLQALGAQTVRRDALEIIVIDDGSTDATEEAIRAYRQVSPLDLTYLKQSNRGPGAARNAGIVRANYPFLVFLGDDTIPDPRFVEEHLACHIHHGATDDVAVVGYTTWAPHLRPSPFLRFIGEQGPQFHYAAAREDTPLGWTFFYTSNLSLPRTLLDRVSSLFDEDLRIWEDGELGYRLLKTGMRLYYNPRAVAYHDHDTDVKRYCQRIVDSGRFSRILLRKHPELEPQLRSTRQVRRWVQWLWGLSGVAAAAGFLDKSFRVPLPRAFYWALVHASYIKGASSRC